MGSVFEKQWNRREWQQKGNIHLRVALVVPVSAVVVVAVDSVVAVPVKSGTVKFVQKILAYRIPFIKWVQNTHYSLFKI